MICVWGLQKHTLQETNMGMGMDNPSAVMRFQRGKPPLPYHQLAKRVVALSMQKCHRDTAQFQLETLSENIWMTCKAPLSVSSRIGLCCSHLRLKGSRKVSCRPVDLIWFYHCCFNLPLFLNLVTDLWFYHPSINYSPKLPVWAKGGGNSSIPGISELPAVLIPNRRMVDHQKNWARGSRGPKPRKVCATVLSFPPEKTKQKRDGQLEESQNMTNAKSITPMTAQGRGSSLKMILSVRFVSVRVPPSQASAVGFLLLR